MSQFILNLFYFLITNIIALPIYKLMEYFITINFIHGISNKQNLSYKHWSIKNIDNNNKVINIKKTG